MRRIAYAVGFAPGNPPIRAAGNPTHWPANGRARAPWLATPNQAIAQHRGVDLSQLFAAEFDAKSAVSSTPSFCASRRTR
jgi:hypothetical protein